jgi:hypothetical protein
MKTIGSVALISCALLLSACAVDVSGEEFAEETAELEGETVPSDSPAVADEAEPNDESLENARPSEPIDDEVATPDLAAKGRHVLPENDGACHSFDHLRAISDAYCTVRGCVGATWRNYTHGCDGWWGHGARYVWFTCLCNGVSSDHAGREAAIGDQRAEDEGDRGDRMLATDVEE